MTDERLDSICGHLGELGFRYGFEMQFQRWQAGCRAQASDRGWKPNMWSPDAQHRWADYLDAAGPLVRGGGLWLVRGIHDERVGWHPGYAYFAVIPQEQVRPSQPSEQRAAELQELLFETAKAIFPLHPQTERTQFDELKWRVIDLKLQLSNVTGPS